MEIKPVITEDGSHTLFVPDLNEHYHSSHGAITESGHIFLDAGFAYLSASQSALTILEIGFGTGLNALMTFTKASDLKINVTYLALEPFPVDPEILASLNYSSLLPGIGIQKWFNRLHSSDWNQPEELSPSFRLIKIRQKLQDYHPLPASVDLVYYDAFSPEVQPELWTAHIFGKLYQAMKSEGILVTYSCKGAVKRALVSAGFLIEKLPGPPGKREFLRARKP